MKLFDKFISKKKRQKHFVGLVSFEQQAPQLFGAYKNKYPSIMFEILLFTPKNV